MGKARRIELVHPDWCKACGICAQICPAGILAIKDGRVRIEAVEKCIVCENCELICPDFVLKVVEADE